MSYVLRNPLHHGVAPTPYGYMHSSANVIFKREMGKFHLDKPIPSKFIAKHIGKRAQYPPHYKMNEAGLFLRETVLDIPQVEHMYLTPRSFDFYMNRKSGEEWQKEQLKDDNANPVICLDNIEFGTGLSSSEKMLINENGRSDYRKMSDHNLCVEIDRIVKLEYSASSIYHLSKQEKRQIAERMYRAYHVSKDQLVRCLALK